MESIATAEVKQLTTGPVTSTRGIKEAESPDQLAIGLPIGLGVSMMPPHHRWAFIREFIPPLPMSLVIPCRIGPVDYDRVLEVGKMLHLGCIRPNIRAAIPSELFNYYISVPKERVPQRAGDYADVFAFVNIPANLRPGYWRFRYKVVDGFVGLIQWFGYVVPGIEWDIQCDTPSIEYDGQKIINRFSWVDHPGAVDATFSVELYKGTELIYQDTWSGDAHAVVIDEMRPGESWGEMIEQSWDFGILDIEFPVGQLANGDYTYRAEGDFGKWGVLTGQLDFMVKENVFSAPGGSLLIPDPWRTPAPTLPWPTSPVGVNPHILSKDSPEYFEPNYHYYTKFEYVNLGRTGNALLRLIDTENNELLLEQVFSNTFAGVTYTVTIKSSEVIPEGEIPPTVLYRRIEFGHLEDSAKVIDWRWDYQVPLKGYVILISFGLGIENAPSGSHSWNASWITSMGTERSPLTPLEQSFQFSGVPPTGALYVDTYDQDDIRITDGVPWGEYTLEDGKDYIADFATKTLREAPPVGRRDPLDTFIRTMEGIRPKCPVGAIETAWLGLTDKVIEITPAIKILPPG